MVQKEKRMATINVNGKPSSVCPACGEDAMIWVTDDKRYPHIVCGVCNRPLALVGICPECDEQTYFWKEVLCADGKRRVYCPECAVRVRHKRLASESEVKHG